MCNDCEHRIDEVIPTDRGLKPEVGCKLNLVPADCEAEARVDGLIDRLQEIPTEVHAARNEFDVDTMKMLCDEMADILVEIAEIKKGVIV